MEKILKYLYYSGLFLLVFGVVYMTTVMYLSPRQDMQERGFIPCTKQLVFDLSGCSGGEIKCPLKLLWQDMKCNVKVVGTGAKDWLKGKQAAPWSNYLFEPELLPNDEAYPYAEEINQSIPDFEKQHDFILQKQQELEEAKQRNLNLEKDLLLSNPERALPTEAALPEPSNLPEPTDEAGDISDEAEIGAIPTDGAQKNNAAPNNSNLLHKLNKITDDQLKKGNLQDEK